VNINNLKLAVIGLGYVGLPLAIEFGKVRYTIGFDLNKKRINDLKSGFDKTLEVKKKDISGSKNLIFTYNQQDLNLANCYIITVPTPINKYKKPDLKHLIAASKIVGNVLKKGDIVIYESTVYPGCTEEDCIPTLEKFSKLKYNFDFFCGYSPERINPGDKIHRIQNIKKITSGSTPKTSDLIDALYNEIITAGTFRAKSIKVAEAAKVIENTQRDLNIALINELTILFKKMNIDTEDVLKAAGSKWNFLPFRPGLVGGHCIGVDPYYLTHKAKKVNHEPKIILSGRKINDNMSNYVVKEFLKALRKKLINIKKAKILIMGLSFKENCPDLRNSGVSNVIKQLKKYKFDLDLYDPWADSDEVKKLYGSFPLKKPKSKTYDGIIIVVAHKLFKKMGIKKISKFGKEKHIIYDLKYIFPKKQTDLRL
tara:strand:+ start:2542 stop:3816 length:1275 start_codon:yes stop_codon:yes gene_type:complete